MHKRWISCIWILPALLVAASLDAIPDPPALGPHFAATKVPGPNEGPAIVTNPSGNGLNLFVQFQAQGTILVRDAKPGNPASFIAQMGQAADSSPPARTLRSW